MSRPVYRVTEPGRKAFPSISEMAALQERNHRWRMLFIHANEGIALFREEHDGRGGRELLLEDANPVFRCFLGLSDGPNQPAPLSTVAAAISDGWVQFLGQAIQIGATVTQEGVSGHGRNFSLLAVRYTADHVALYLTDITERKQVEARVKTAQRLESIGLLVSGITHDMNNLLTPGWVATSMLRRRHRDPQDIRLISLLEGATASAAKMIGHIMRSVRETGKSGAIHPTRALADVVEMLRCTLPPTINIDLSSAKQMAPAGIDHSCFSQVMLNLAVNARDAMPDGGTLFLRAEEVEIGDGHAPQWGVAAPGRYVMFTVADSGQGIPAENIDRVFEPFFTTKGPGLGTGLGLPRVKEIIQQHHGSVGLRSTPGQGTDIRLFVPVLDGEAAEEFVEEVEPVMAPVGEMQRIMIVDDYEGLRETLTLVLESNGFESVVAADGHEALKMLGDIDEQPVLLLVDLGMPRTNGEELVRHLRAEGNLTPIVVMTAHGPGDKFLETEARLQNLGVSAILRKPFREPELLQAIMAALPLTSSQP